MVTDSDGYSIESQKVKWFEQFEVFLVRFFFFFKQIMQFWKSPAEMCSRFFMSVFSKIIMYLANESQIKNKFYF